MAFSPTDTLLSSSLKQPALAKSPATAEYRDSGAGRGPSFTEQLQQHRADKLDAKRQHRAAQQRDEASHDRKTQNSSAAHSTVNATERASGKPASAGRQEQPAARHEVNRNAAVAPRDNVAKNDGVPARNPRGQEHNAQGVYPSTEEAVTSAGQDGEALTLDKNSSLKSVIASPQAPTASGIEIVAEGSLKDGVAAYGEGDAELVEGLSVAVIEGDPLVEPGLQSEQAALSPDFASLGGNQATLAAFGAASQVPLGEGAKADAASALALKAQPGPLAFETQRPSGLHPGSATNIQGPAVEEGVAKGVVTEFDAFLEGPGKLKGSALEGAMAKATSAAGQQDGSGKDGLLKGDAVVPTAEVLSKKLSAALNVKGLVQARPEALGQAYSANGTSVESNQGQLTGFNHQFQLARGADVQGRTAMQSGLGQAQWSEEVAEKVAWFSARNISTAEIRLDPPELGSLQVKIQLSQEQAQVTFNSPHASVREALDQTSVRLREMFEQQGLDLVDVNVGSEQQQQAEAEAEQDGWAGQGEDPQGNEPEVSAGTLAVSQVGLVDSYA